MIINRGNETFRYNGKNYHIGDRVRVLDGDDYSGLIGTIIEIRDGEDKETDNETPDVYCCFDDPETPEVIQEIEERFSRLYDELKTLEDICLDEVIMDPDFLEVLPNEIRIRKMVFLKWKFARNLEILDFLNKDNPIKLDENGDCNYDECNDKWWQIEDMEIEINGWPRLFLGVVEGKDDAAILAAAKERFGFPVEALETEQI